MTLRNEVTTTFDIYLQDLINSNDKGIKNVMKLFEQVENKGISYSALRAYLKGRAVPPFEKARQILKEFRFTTHRSAAGRCAGREQEKSQRTQRRDQHFHH